MDLPHQAQVEKYLVPQNEYIFTNGLIADGSKLCELLSDVDAVVIGSENIDKTSIDSAKNLKVIVRFGTTIENIDVDYAEKVGIKVFSIKSKHTVIDNQMGWFTCCGVWKKS